MQRPSVCQTDTPRVPKISNLKHHDGNGKNAQLEVSQQPLLKAISILFYIQTVDALIHHSELGLLSAARITA